MARWTQSQQEIVHLSKMNELLWRELTRGFLIQVRLIDGRVFEGFLIGQNVGNNAGTMKPPTAYYSEFTLRMINHQTILIDILDVRDVENITNPVSLADFAKAGVIEIVDTPTKGRAN